VIGRRRILPVKSAGGVGRPATFMPPITKVALAEMTHSPRSRMGRFLGGSRKLRIIDYKSAIPARKSIIRAVLRD